MNNILKERLASNKVCIGGWITAPIPVVAEAMAKLGFHWVAVDMEHAPISGDLQGVFIALEKYDVAPMVGFRSLDPSLGRRVLDAGAAGLIVPAVEDAIEFGEFAAHCFTPKGTRGVGLSRCNGWGETFEDYLELSTSADTPDRDSSRCGSGPRNLGAGRSRCHLRGSLRSVG